MTLIQLAAPDHLRGRIMGIWMIVYSGSVPLGALWTGGLAQVVGRRDRDGFSAVICVVAALMVWASGVLEANAASVPPFCVDGAAAVIASPAIRTSHGRDDRFFDLVRPDRRQSRNRPSRLPLRILLPSRTRFDGM